MNEISDLYQEIIIDHSRSPKNFGHLSDKTHQAEGHNPLCGDNITLEVRVKDNIIDDIAFFCNTYNLFYCHTLVSKDSE